MFSNSDAHFITRKMKNGEVVLFLGAGASHGSLNSLHKPIFKGKQLESAFRDYLQEDSDDLDLGDLAEDVIDKSEPDFLSILKDQFLDCTPSAHLKHLLKYTWYRCYTLNYDDTLTHIPRHERSQKIVPYSRLSKVEEERGFHTLQTVYLNGSITHPSEGFILSGKQYRSELRNPSPWYLKCAQDFANRSFVFVGTELNEPIFQAYIEALQSSTSSFSQSFLISPDRPSERKISKLAEYNIIYVEGTLETFSQWLQINLGEQITPTDVISVKGLPVTTGDHDIAIASMLTQIGTSEWRENLNISPQKKRMLGRDFYSGMAPTWEVIANSIYADIECIRSVKGFLSDRSGDVRGGISIVKGRSGSGKTTATMASLFELSRSENARVYEILEHESSSIERAIYYLGRQVGPKKMLFVRSIHLHVDFLDKFSIACQKTGVEVIGQVRLSDWSGRFGRRKQHISYIHDLTSLTNRDYERLATALSTYAVAPDFQKLDRTAQIFLLKRSKRQLLILMLEATKQRAFEEIIENEFSQLDDEDLRTVFCIVSLITMSRSRLSVGEIENIVDGFGIKSSFKNIIQRLDGMVDVTPSNHLIGRHDLFVRHVIEHAADHNLIKDSVVAILESFTIYDVPFVKNAGKAKGNILKFLIRARFLQEIFGPESHLFIKDIYSELEFSYQNDGHYWLQRGKYYQNRGEHPEALKYFYRSVEAYDNEYARHSLAHQKLIYCSQFSASSPRLIALLKEGVEELERQVEVRDDAEDEYPIVALSRQHPEVLLKWGLVDKAIEKAKEYFERLKIFDRGLSYRDPSLENAMSFCAHVATQGSFPSNYSLNPPGGKAY